MRPSLALAFLALSVLTGCVTVPSGNETAGVRTNLARISTATARATGDGKQLLDTLALAERDAKEIRRLLRLP